MLRRTPTETLPPTPPVEHTTKDITLLEVMLDNGMPLSFDLESGDNYALDDDWLYVLIGDREIKINRQRVFVIEKRPHKRIVAKKETV